MSSLSTEIEAFLKIGSFFFVNTIQQAFKYEDTPFKSNIIFCVNVFFTLISLLAPLIFIGEDLCQR